MHSHEHDVDAAVSLRPKAARLTEAAPLAARAAAEGRWDAVGTAGMAQLQRAAGNAGVSSALAEDDRSPVHDVVSSGGRPLDGLAVGVFASVHVSSDPAAYASPCRPS